MKPNLYPVLLLLALAAAPARAGVDVDFGAAVPLGDDGSLFVSISSRYFDREPRLVEDWGRRYYPDPDDLAVALFLARHCDRGPEFTFNLRREGLGWFEISNRCRVPVDAFFVDLDRDPGPPYGKAYGHWRKHQRDRRHAVDLDDADIRNLVAARMLHEYYGVPYETAMRWRADGLDLRKTMAGEYRKRHGGGRDANNDADKGHGKASDKGRDQGKLHGDDHKDGQGQGKGSGNGSGKGGGKEGGKEGRGKSGLD